MSHSPSYSPVLDFAAQIQLNENLNDDSDPVTNPFYYAQDRENWYNEVAAKACEENKQQKALEKKLKKRKTFKNKSYILRNKTGLARRMIKIFIYDLDSRGVNETDIKPDNASVNVQYIVTNDYDDVETETEYLVSKIVKKLSDSNM